MQYLQLALPIALIIWLAVMPLAGRARVVHVAMTVAVVAALILTLPWLWPNVYAPVGLILLLALAILLGRHRAVDRRNARLWPGMVAGMATLVAMIAAVGLVIARLRPAMTLDLGLPFATAMVITQGGARQIINTHRAVTDANSPSLSGWQGMADGISLQPVDNLGRVITTAQPVVAPCAGTVVGQGMDTRLGRYVMVQCADHMIVLSDLTSADARGAVTQGQPIGTALTLTLHAQSPGTAAHPFSGTPAAISLNGTYPVRGFVLRP